MRRRERGQKKTIGKHWKTGGILAALCASVAVYGAMVYTEKEILTQYEKASIYTAVKEIPKGTVITAKNRNNFLEVKQLDKSCIPSTALTDAGWEEGMAAVYHIDCGTLLTEGMFETPEEMTAGMEEPCVAGFKAEDLYQVAGGVLRQGDKIHIYSVSQEGDTELIWENVYVQAVFQQTGVGISPGDTSSSAHRVNIYLDRAEVPRFYSELAGGSIRVVKVAE